MNYTLNNDEIEKINGAILKSCYYSQSTPRLENYVKAYENHPEKYTSQGDRVRYLASKQNLTLNTLETLLGLPGGSIANSSRVTNHRIDAFLSAFFNVPISDFRSLKRHRARVKKTPAMDPVTIVKKLRKLADEIEKGTE